MPSVYVCKLYPRGNLTGRSHRQQDLESMLAIKCHLKYRFGGLETFVLAIIWIIWKYALWHHPAETTFPTGQSGGAEAERSM